MEEMARLRSFLTMLHHRWLVVFGRALFGTQSTSEQIRGPRRLQWVKCKMKNAGWCARWKMLENTLLIRTGKKNNALLKWHDGRIGILWVQLMLRTEEKCSSEMLWVEQQRKACADVHTKKGKSREWSLESEVHS